MVVQSVFSPGRRDGLAWGKGGLVAIGRSTFIAVIGLSHSTKQVSSLSLFDFVSF